MKLTCLSEASDKMPTRQLGKTGHKVSILSLGGQGALETHKGKHKEMVEIIERAHELGVNYFDTSPIYGKSEQYYGEALKPFRNKIFLASKTDDRTRDGSMRILEKSLKTLKTDYLDLWQVHHLDKVAEVNQVAGGDGALEAMIEMKEQGVIKNIGLTGHQDPQVLVEMIRRHPFDVVLCPANASDIHMKPSFSKKVMPLANNLGMGIVGMKVFSQGFIFHPRGITTAWEALTYAMSMPLSTIIVGCDSVAQLEENVAIAKQFQPMTSSQTKQIENKTNHYLKRSQFFRSKYGGYGSKDRLDPPYTVSGLS